MIYQNSNDGVFVGRETVFDALSIDHKSAVEKLMQVSFETKSLEFDLGVIHPGEAVTRNFLIRLSEVIDLNMYGTKFRCSVDCQLSVEDIQVLRRARVVRVALLCPSEKNTPSGKSAVVLNMFQLGTVRRLHQVGIEVEWELLAPYSHDLQLCSELIRLCKSAQHLPPPIRLIQAGEKTLQDVENMQLLDAITNWQHKYSPGTLTSACGPGFLRILDRRAGSRDWSIIVLCGKQFELFSQIDAVQFMDKLSNNNSLPMPSIQNLMAELDERRLVFLSECAAVGLVPKRRHEEQWASGDH